jgi:hypothetical protein
MCHGNEGKATYPVEWKTACAGGGPDAGTTFPYGDTYVPHRCVDAMASGPVAVGSLPLCQGGFPGIFDLSGNVGEWLDCGCEFDTPDPTQNDAFVGGGGYLESGDALACAPARTEHLVSFHADIGARCCYLP